MNEKFTDFVYPMQEMYKIFLMVSWLKESFNFNRKMQSCISISFEFEVIIWCAFFIGVSEYDDIFLLLHPCVYLSIWLSVELPVYLSNWLAVRLSVISRHSCIHCLIISSGTDQRDFFCVMHLLFNINLLWMNFTRLRFNFVDLNLIEIFSF